MVVRLTKQIPMKKLKQLVLGTIATAAIIAFSATTTKAATVYPDIYAEIDLDSSATNIWSMEVYPGHGGSFITGYLNGVKQVSIIDDCRTTTEVDWTLGTSGVHPLVNAPGSPVKLGTVMIWGRIDAQHSYIYLCSKDIYAGDPAWSPCINGILYIDFGSCTTFPYFPTLDYHCD